MDLSGILNSVVVFIGSIGGLGGIIGALISIYNAKSNKETIDIKNLKEIVEEYNKLYTEVSEDYKKYKEDTMNYISEFKDRFNKMDVRLKKIEKVVLSGYKCPYPPKDKTCPIVAEYEQLNNNEYETKDGN